MNKKLLIALLLSGMTVVDVVAHSHKVKKCINGQCCTSCDHEDGDDCDHEDECDGCDEEDCDDCNN